MNWHIGCSGFTYDSWKEKFYPASVPKKFWFEYYCQFFNTVELNVTFYRLPRVEVFRGWYERSPGDFLFTVKAPRLITHYNRFHHSKENTRMFYDRVSTGLREKLGTVLFQLHPQMEYSKENLEQVLSVMDPSFRNVIEFRHVSWWNEEVKSRLESRKIIFCSISYPGLPGEVIKTADTLYYRFHGVPSLYRSLYTSEKLEEISTEIQRKKAKDCFAYFNNDVNAHAIMNAVVLKEILRM